MLNTKKSKNHSRNNQVVLPFMKGGLGTIATGLIVLGILLNWKLPFVVGLCMALRWGYLYQKVHVWAKIWWKILVLLLIVSVIYVTVCDIRKFW